MSLRKISHATLATIFGSLLIFASWIASNVFEPDWTERKLQLQRSQLVLDILNVERGQWEIVFEQERRKPLPDSSLLGLAAFNILRTRFSYLGWGAARVADDSIYDRIIREKNGAISSFEMIYKQGMYRRLTELAASSRSLIDTLVPRQDHYFSERVEHVRSEERWWSILSQLGYTLGSALLGFAFWFTKVRPEIRKRT